MSISTRGSVESLSNDVVLKALELQPGQKTELNLQLPAQFIIVFEPVTHSARFIDVQERTDRRTAASVAGL